MVVVSYRCGSNLPRNAIAASELHIGHGNATATLFGMPMFAYLLLRSKSAHGNGGSIVEGRGYPHAAQILSSSVGPLGLETGNWQLKTSN